MVSTGEIHPLPVGTIVGGASLGDTAGSEDALGGRLGGELQAGAARTHAKRWASTYRCFRYMLPPGHRAG